MAADGEAGFSGGMRKAASEPLRTFGGGLLSRSIGGWEMARGVAFSLLVLACASSGAANGATYANARFGYRIDYPAETLVPGREADNGDGREFRARRGPATMVAWGRYNALDQSPAQIARDEAQDCHGGKVSYRIAKPRLVAFSCVTPSRRILYQKTLIGADVLATIRFDYPLEERATWDSVVKTVAGSLRLGPGAP